MQVTSDRMRKGQRKMRALASAIGRFNDECTRASGSVALGPALEMDHIDAAVNALDDALVAIRTLDQEIFECSDPSAYASVRDGARQGMVVRALTAPRNNAVHHAIAVDPDLARAIGPLENGNFIIFPRWKPRSSLPRAMFEHAHGKRKGTDHADYINTYDAAAAERLVLDTLMDAFAFFDLCDERIADRDQAGNLVGFPLQPLPVADCYHRLGPDWPDSETVDQKIRASVSSEPPSGDNREISGRLTTPSGVVYCGYTNVDTRRRHVFTEAAEQVLRDVGLGYDYFVAVSDGRLSVDARAGRLSVAGDLVESLLLPDWTDREDEPWAGWWEICVSDAHYYRRQRRSH